MTMHPPLLPLLHIKEVTLRFRSNRNEYAKLGSWSRMRMSDCKVFCMSSASNSAAIDEQIAFRRFLLNVRLSMEPFMLLMMHLTLLKLMLFSRKYHTMFIVAWSIL
uniref:Uncharacterized protein n=1 Tax=Arundo donax TaxID=35708 RepID=A0A0A9EEB8_ARUDO